MGLLEGRISGQVPPEVGVVQHDAAHLVDLKRQLALEMSAAPNVSLKPRVNRVHFIITVTL